ncbi:hypothetical protein D3C72_649890 [compost metagenome]
MKTLFKTVTVVSIATLTAVGTTQLNFSSRFNTTEKGTTPTFDIIMPAEANVLASNQQASALNYTAVGLSTDLTNTVAFEPSSEFSVSSLTLMDESSTLKASDLLISYGAENSVALDELIRFEPEIVDVSDQLFLDEVISFKPSTDVATENIAEPMDMDDLIKFNPAEVNHENIVEPESSINQLIKFEPVLAAEVIEPVNIDELVKFKVSDCQTSIIEEPVISSPCNYITEFNTGL